MVPAADVLAADVPAADVPREEDDEDEERFRWWEESADSDSESIFFDSDGSDVDVATEMKEEDPLPGDGLNNRLEVLLAAGDKMGLGKHAAT